MRINNNMLAINTHRQMGGVALAQGKSMEKLSSGFRINRAGDDAAGLAISEKMRAQIRGLNTAAKNAQDGISLIQTAEGALQEVHSMLNRMVELATQSANGTFDDSVDRKNLESEVTALKDEINRVAKSSNFNGIKLLNGDLSSSAVKNKIADVVVNGVSGQAAAGGANDVITIIKASESKFSGIFETDGASGGANLKFVGNNKQESIKSMVKFKDESGTEHTIDITLQSTGKNDKKVDWANSKVLLDGKEVELGQMPEMTLDGTGTNDNTTTALKKVLEKIDSFNEQFKITSMKDANTIAADNTLTNNKMLKIESKNAGTDAEVLSILFNGHADQAQEANAVYKDIVLSNVQNAKEDKITVDGTKMFSFDKDDANVEDAIKTATVQVNGEKFIFVAEEDKNDPKVKEALEKNGFDKEHIIVVVKLFCNITT